MAMCMKTQSKGSQTSLPTLPTEIWLQILENIPTNGVEHLWDSTRYVSSQFRNYIEALFMTTYIPLFAISLALPRRDPETSALKWRYAVPKAHIIMSFDAMTSDQHYAIFVSPLELNDDSTKSIEELKSTNMLPKERLLEAPTWVYVNRNYMTGRKLVMPMDIEWDDERRRWVWLVDWRKLVSRYYRAKMEARGNWF